MDSSRIQERPNLPGPVGCILLTWVWFCSSLCIISIFKLPLEQLWVHFCGVWSCPTLIKCKAKKLKTLIFLSKTSLFLPPFRRARRRSPSIDRPLGETWSKSFSVQSHTRSSMIESPLSLFLWKWGPKSFWSCIPIYFVSNYQILGVYF